MRLDDIQEASNVEDRRGQGGFGGGMPGGRAGLGFGTIAVLTLAGWMLGIDPRILIGGAEIVSGGRSGPVVSRQSGPPRQGSPQEEALFSEVRKVLQTTNDIFGQLMPQQAGVRYSEPRLVVFTQATRSGCGPADAGMGPFYCPPDQRVYIDLAFYEEMRRKLRADGDFARAYVIAHEVGHHIENILGILPKVQAAQQRLSRKEANALSVRVELMADCLAGVWGHHMQRQGRLEPGDMEEGLRAASAIGDDTLQGRPGDLRHQESFTHGSSEQRMRWLQQGLRTGDIRQCDTFSSRAI